MQPQVLLVTMAEQTKTKSTPQRKFNILQVKDIKDTILMFSNEASTYHISGSSVFIPSQL